MKSVTPAVAAGVAVGFDLRKQRLGRTPVLLGAVRIDFERLFQRLVKRGQFARPLTPRYFGAAASFGRSEPFAYRVARQTRALRNFMQRQFVA